MENTKQLSNEQILFIKKIKKLRELNSWTIKELSEESGVSKGYISDIEAGLKKNISKDIFSKLIFAFKKNPKHFSEEDEYELYSYYLKSTIPDAVYKLMVKSKKS